MKTRWCCSTRAPQRAQKKSIAIFHWTASGVADVASYITGMGGVLCCGETTSHSTLYIRDNDLCILLSRAIICLDTVWSYYCWSQAIISCQYFLNIFLFNSRMLWFYYYIRSYQAFSVYVSFIRHRKIKTQTVELARNLCRLKILNRKRNLYRLGMWVRYQPPKSNYPLFLGSVLWTIIPYYYILLRNMNIHKFTIFIWWNRNGSASNIV